MKKILKVAASMLLAVAMTTPAFAAPTETNTEKFSDINTENFAWAKPYINEMAEKGLIAGYSDGTFKPDNDVTRLEALSLFARAMGSTNEVNEEILEIAHEKYDDVIKNYGLTWGKDEIAYLMYKGALKKTDLDTYLKDKEKDTPMKRYEAAIIITKAMGGEAKALSDLGVVLDYTDAREVPANAIQYVGFATDNKIMEGMGNNTFSPNTTVKRSQMAVMLSRTVDKTNYKFEKQKLVSIDASTRTITTRRPDGEEGSYVYTDDTAMKNRGDETQPKDMYTGVDAILTFAGDKLVAVDTTSTQPDKTVTGTYVSYSTSSAVTTIRVTPIGETEVQSYECASDLAVTYDGTPATIRSFTKGDVMTLQIVNGKVSVITGENKTTTISGAIVESVSVDEEVTMKISHGDKSYDGQTYIVSNDVSVTKNEAPSSLDKIYKGDRVTLTLEYGVISKIKASSNQKVVEGTIQALTISTQSTMLVKVKDEVMTYEIPKNVEILINGEEGSLYDFRVNDKVKLTLESDAIKKIVAETTQESSGNITGVVTGVNTSYGVISVLPTGADDSKQAFCKDDATTFVTADGKSKKMKDIKVGQTVDIRGTVSNGVFVGKLVVIVTE